MTGIYIMLGTMVLFATVLTVWDQIGQRQERRDLTAGDQQMRPVEFYFAGARRSRSFCQFCTIVALKR